MGNKKTGDFFAKFSIKNIRNLKKDQLLILLLLGILLVVIAIPVGGEDEEAGSGAGSGGLESGSGEGAAEGTAGSQAEYVKYMEEKLADTLSQIEGAGEVTVMITLESSAERIVEKDETYEGETVTESDSQGGSRDTDQSSREETTVYAQGDGQDGTPYISKELSPKIGGVVVIAPGGDKAQVKQNITEAVEALFGVESHKIRIMKKHQT